MRGRDVPAAGEPAPGDLTCHQKGAQSQGQSLFFIDESGFYPLPSVVRTYAPVGHTPILEEWWTRDHLSAISAISPEGKLYFHCQEEAINSAAASNMDRSSNAWGEASLSQRPQEPAEIDAKADGSKQ